jgi:phospholipid/cholesterol/gamma-HCH transport system substrate-binding protein
MRRVPAALVLLALAGCTSDGLAGVPLPGGAPDGPSYRVVVEFGDVLDLVPQSAVKVNDVTVGTVETIWLEGWTARVRVRVGVDVRLPDNATAAVRQTSLLGEKFVDLAAPTDEAPRGELADGDVIPLSRTGRNVEVEEVLAALGLVLNGGGLQHLRTINDELASALEGRETDARDALRQLDAFVGGLDAQKDDIVRAIDAIDRLAGRLAGQTRTIGAAVDALAPGLAVLADQRQQLTRALTALRRLGRVGGRVVTATRADLLASLRALRPVLDQLVRAGDALPKALDFMLTFPFPPNVTGAIVGNQVNLHVSLDANAADILANLLAAAPPAAEPDEPDEPTLPTLPTPPTLPGLPLPGLPSLPPLPLPSISGLPTLPGLPGVPGLPLPTLPGLPIARGAEPPGAVARTAGTYASVVTRGVRA